ncbi:MAG: 4-hydroxy-4-methyl-2-oxoglutarate aldolase [Alteromonadaceae bacterium]|jgi:4-hydroxy-4-methyl-2-oxoglutarate aldolase
MTINSKIISFIKKNRVSTTEVADALGKTGVLADVLPVIEEQHEVGRIHCVFAANESNYQVHDEINKVKENDIIIVFVHNCAERAILGDLVSKYSLLYRGAKALVVDGKVRDIAAIKRSRFKVWCKGTTPIGCFNIEADRFPQEKRDYLMAKYNGAIAVCDDGGVVIIDNDNINEEILEKLHRIEIQEDIWFFCLDTLKWDTKKIVCDKKYLTETDLLSSAHIEQLSELNKPLDTKGYPNE